MDNNIKKIRKTQKLLQRDLAVGVHCTAMNISRYENGSREPDLAMAFRIARYLNVTMEELFNPPKDPWETDGGNDNESDHNTQNHRG